MKNDKQRGSVLLYTLLIMIATTTISIALMRLLLPKFRIVREAVSSTMALYAADSALEWCAYVNNAQFYNAYYPLSEGTGNTSADISGNGNTLNLSGPTWTAGHSGFGLSFDGILDDAIAPASSSFDIAGSFTISSWINPNSITSPGDLTQSIMVKGTGATANYGLRQVMDEVSCFFYSSGVLKDHITTNANLTVGAWHNISCTLDDTANTLTIFKDGAIIFGPVSETSTPDVNTDVFQIGKNWTGKLDDVKILDSAAPNSTSIVSIASPSMSNGSSYVIYRDNSPGSKCDEGVFDHRAVGTFQGISRSLEVFRKDD
jgi:hypothetical protein